MKLEEEHQDIFMSLESAVISCSKVNPAIKDADVLRAYESLANAFTRKKKAYPICLLWCQPKQNLSVRLFSR